MLGKFIRKGSRSDFSFRKKKSNLPTFSERPAPIEEQHGPEAQRKEKEVDANKDEEVEEEAGRNPQSNASEQPNVTKGKNTARDNDPSDKPLIQKPGAIKGTHAAAAYHSLFWDLTSQYRLTVPTYKENAYYVPNALGLIELFRESSTLVGRLKWIREQEPQYCEYAALTGLCLAYYYQILRAKKGADDLINEDFSAYNRFDKLIKEENVVIAGPFYPFFRSIGSTHLDDARFQWVVPDYGNLDNMSSFETLFEGGIVSFVRPNIPLMVAMLATFASEEEDVLPTKFDSGYTYRPLALNGTVTLMNSQMQFRATEDHTDVQTQFNHLGFSYPFRFYNDNYDEAWRHIRNSGFLTKTRDFGATDVSRDGRINVALTNGRTVPGRGNTNPLRQTIDCNTIEKFLFNTKRHNLKWMEYCFEQLRIFSMHFEHPFNLSDVPTVIGLETSIIGQMKMSQIVDPANNRYVYADRHLGNEHESEATWYQNKFEDVTCSFKTTRTTVVREEEYQANTFAINSNPPIHTADVTEFRHGEYFRRFDLDGHTYGASGSEAETREGRVPLFSGWNSAVLRPMLLAKPAKYVPNPNSN